MARGNKFSPSLRVRLALKRISRNRWLSPDEVCAAAKKLTLCLSSGGSSFNSIIKASYAQECEHVGMINGQPPSFHFEPHYGRVIDARQKAKKSKHNKVLFEIELLKIMMGVRR